MSQVPLNKCKFQEMLFHGHWMAKIFWQAYSRRKIFGQTVDKLQENVVLFNVRKGEGLKKENLHTSF